MTLYHENTAFWDGIATSKPCLSEMARHFSSDDEMAIALGFSRGTVRKWVTGHNGISGTAERRAKEWLSARSKAPNSDGMVMLVACSAAMALKVQKVLGILGCDVTEI
ncbi:MAG: hypothetical protein RLW68_00975 [Devosia marina]|uniref:hypothetical protein n=1 Tax=Devosia marina TaxID=2683198 RepID=UPI0032F099B4